MVSTQPVIEFLTFDVPPTERDEWLAIEELHWSRFLERQPGFIRKEIWLSRDAPSAVHAVIWWESMAHWKQIEQGELDRVVEAMGSYERTATCSSFDVLRQG